MSTISAGTSNTTSLVYTGDTTGNLAFQINGTTEAMRITSGGNVGIGTASPEKNFDILVAGADPTANLQVRANRTGYGNVRAGLSVYAAGSSSTDITTLLNEGGVLAFQTGSTERMRIDSNGYVTKPYQPAFHAVRTAGNVSSTGIFICNTVTFNDGNNYNSSTGRFTAPVTGRYQMNFFVLAQNGNSFDFAIRVGGVQYAGMDIRCNGGIAGNFTLSCSAILKLVANDTVDPYVAALPAGPIYGLGLNAFSMYFLG